MNWYVYCNNDPVNYFDPSGNTTEWDRQNVTSQKDLDDLDALEELWQDATSDEARVFAHACAESIRDKYRGPNEIGLADGNTIVVKDAVINKDKGIYGTAPVEWYMNQDTGVQFVTGLVASRSCKWYCCSWCYCYWCGIFGGSSGIRNRSGN